MAFYPLRVAGWAAQVGTGHSDEKRKGYVFSLVASARDADGRTALVRLNAAVVEAVEFVN